MIKINTTELSGIIKPHFEQALNDSDLINPMTKTDETDIMTQTDLVIESTLRNYFGRVFTEAKFYGEEQIYLNEALTKGLLGDEWAIVVDPVDGTWTFASGIPTCGTMLAICHYGQVVFGYMYFPYIDEYIYGHKGHGAWLVKSNGDKRQLSVSPKKDANTGMCSPSLFSAKDRTILSPLLLPFSRVVSLSCSCYEYRTLLLGHSDFYLTQRKINLWDHLAGLMLFEEAGGFARCLSGKKYTVRDQGEFILVSRNRHLWESLRYHFKPLLI